MRKIANSLNKIRKKKKIKPSNIDIFSPTEEHKTAYGIRDVINNKNIFEPKSVKREFFELLDCVENKEKGYIFIADQLGIKDMLDSMGDIYKIDDSCNEVKQGTVISVENNDVNKVEVMFSL
ncbi:MAG: hypothetical protein ISR98_01230 [Parcubacteria group bacterium]|nr:hypothetical protein [Parcubacteria group bacterium]